MNHGVIVDVVMDYNAMLSRCSCWLGAFQLLGECYFTYQ